VLAVNDMVEGYDGGVTPRPTIAASPGTARAATATEPAPTPTVRLVSSAEGTPAPLDSTKGLPAASGPVIEALPGRKVDLGDGLAVRRILPGRKRRMVGPWCLVDHFGPTGVARGPGMRVAPHPHIGIRTATWLVEGAVLHRDSLGNEQRIRPGQLNLMTTAGGMAHSEESPEDRPPLLHGVQLWAAMPDQGRHGPAAFDHFPVLPTTSDGRLELTVILGDQAGMASPAGDVGPVAALSVVISPPPPTPLASTGTPPASTAGAVALDPAFEYGVIVLEGEAVIGGVSLGVGAMLYLGRGRSELTLDAEGTSRLLVLGGAPFGEPVVMWWNFVARSDREIRAAREDWMAGRRFGSVAGFDGEQLAAPELPAGRLRPR